MTDDEVVGGVTPCLLTIITRTFNQRPLGLARCVRSVESQSARPFLQHLLIVDYLQRGVGWSFENLRTVVNDVRGDYVMLLDDDDYLIDQHFVEDLAGQVAGCPEVVIVQMDMGGYVLPDEAVWGQAIVHSRIACSCYIVRRDVFVEHVTDFAGVYDGDFRFIEAVINHGHQPLWWKRVVSKIGGVSHGLPEPGRATAISLSA